MGEGTPIRTPEDEVMDDPNIANEVNKARAAARALAAAAPLADLSRSVERQREFMRSVLGPSDGFLAASKAASEAVRSVTKVFESASFQTSLQKSILPTLAGLQRPGVLVDLPKQLADLGRFTPPPSAFLEGLNTSAFKSLANTQLLFDTHISKQLPALQEMVRAITDDRTAWMRDLDSKFLAGLALPQINLRDWLPAIHLPPPPPPGTLLGDLLIVQWERSYDAQKVAALDRLVSRIGWRPRGAVRAALNLQAQIQSRPIALVVRNELRAGLLLALAEQDRPQRHRFGRQWVADEDGRVEEFVPTDLPLDLFWRWLKDETCKAATAALLGLPYPGLGAGDALTRVCAMASLEKPDPHAVDPFAVIVAIDHRPQTMVVALNGLITVATPRQRDLLEALALELQTNPGATFADAARRLKLSPSTARVQRHKLLKKLGLDGQTTLNAYLATLQSTLE
jgi:DNA-binding CsgD family transcriptional regulator